MHDTMRLRAAGLSLALLLAAIAIWAVATLPSGHDTKPADTSSEYAMLMGKGPDMADDTVKGFPTPLQFAKIAAGHLADPFYDNGPNDLGVGYQLLYSLGRVMVGYICAMLVALPLGFAIGSSPLLMRALDPFIQVLRPISPLAWMPIALYTIKDSTISSIFVIFICSVWPMLLNTAFGVAAVRKDWVNVARTLEVGPLRKAFLVILPAAAPPFSRACRFRWGSPGW
jgi:nitrate/nitrite transport system permease protein